MIDFIASHIHWAHHAVPVWNKIPDELKGTFYAGESALSYARAKSGDKNIELYKSADALIHKLNQDERLTCVFSYSDNVLASMRPTVFGEHGVGYTFQTSHESYAGSPKGRDNVVLFLCQNEHVYNKNKLAHPKKDAVIVGIPKMDDIKTVQYEYKADPLVCISFHWDCLVSGFTRSSYRFYTPILKQLAKQYKTIGHGHPNIIDRLKPIYTRSGIETVESFDEVLNRADIYCNDSSSTLFEFAFTGRPVVVLNSPYYDKNIDVNDRFWKYADVGINSDYPEQLLGAIEEAKFDPPIQKEKRRDAVNAVFHFTDRKCSERASVAILKKNRDISKIKIQSA